MFIESDIREKFVVKFKVWKSKLFVMVNEKWPDSRGGRLIQILPEKKELIRIEDYFKDFDLNNDLFYLRVSLEDHTLIYEADMKLLQKAPFFVELITDQGYFGITKKDEYLYYFKNSTAKVKWTTKLRTFKTVLLKNQLIVAHFDQAAKSKASVSVLNVESGKIQQEYKILDDENFVPINIWLDARSCVYIFTRLNQVHVFENITGKLIDSWRFNKPPHCYNNKIGSFKDYYEELDIDTQEFSSTDLRPEFEKHFQRPFKIQDKNHISHGLGFVPVLKSHYLGDGVVKDELFLVAIDMATLQIVWKHQLKNTDWKQLEYDGNRIYLLGPSGTLTIFEKEN